MNNSRRRKVKIKYSKLEFLRDNPLRYFENEANLRRNIMSTQYGVKYLDFEVYDIVENEELFSLFLLEHGEFVEFVDEELGS